MDSDLEHFFLKDYRLRLFGFIGTWRQKYNNIKMPLNIPKASIIKLNRIK